MSCGSNSLITILLNSQSQTLAKHLPRSQAIFLNFVGPNVQNLHNCNGVGVVVETQNIPLGKSSSQV
jgi:hypothetical protein